MVFQSLVLLSQLMPQFIPNGRRSPATAARRNRRGPGPLLAILILISHPPGGEAQSVLAPGGSTNVTVDAALVTAYSELARTNHPRIKATESRVRASRSDAFSIRTWEDPEFRFGGTVSSARGPGLREDGNLVYEAEQRLPLFGKAAAQRRVADEEVLAAVTAADFSFQILRREIALTLFRAALAQRAAEIARADRDQLKLWNQHAEQRFNAGEGSQLDLLRLQNELTRREQELISRSNTLSHEQVTLRRLVNLPADQPLPGFGLPAPYPEIPYSGPLVEMAVKNEPQLRVLQQEAQVAKARVSAQRKQRLPDISFGVEGRQFTGDAGFREGTFLVGLNLPWFNRRFYRHEIDREKARASAAAWEAEDYALGVREEVHLLTVRIDSARREALAYTREILPRSELAVKSAATSWMANRGPFNDLMEGRRMHLEAQLNYARAVSEQYQAMSELVLCCGLVDLEAFEVLDQVGAQTTDDKKGVKK